jgi:hypothetical protein
VAAVCSCVLGFCSWRFLGSSSVPCCGGLQARQGRRVLGRGQGAKGPEAALGRHGLQRGGEARCREVQGGAQEAGAQAARAQHRRRLCRVARGGGNCAGHTAGRRRMRMHGG